MRKYNYSTVKKAIKTLFNTDKRDIGCLVLPMCDSSLANAIISRIEDNKVCYDVKRTRTRILIRYYP